MTTVRTHLLFAWLLLFWLDAAITYISVSRFETMELNLLMSGIVTNLPMLLLMKAVASLAIIGLLYKMNERHSFIALKALVAFYALIFVWNGAMILL